LSTVPYTFATASGNVPASQLDANFANVKASVDTAGVVTAEAQPNIRSVGTLTSLTVSGNVNAANFVGNFTGTVSNAVYANTANVATTAISAQTVTASTQLSITQVGTMTVLSVVGNVDGGNLRTVGSVSAIGSVTGLQFIGAGTGLTGTASGLAVATVTTAAQPNITSVGTLTSLVSSGNITTSGGYFLGNGSQLTGIATSSSYAAGDLTGNTLSGNVSNSSLTSVGTLSTLSVTGNITSNANISGSYILGNGSQLTGITATANYNNSNVTTLLSSFGSNTISTTGSITAGNFIGNGSGLSTITGANITGTVSVAATATTAATVTTAAQPNITSVGTLTSVSVTGNITAGNVIATNLSGPVFMANVSAGQGVPTSPSGISQLPLVYDNVIANVGGDYSVGNSSTGSSFTASVPGFYQVSSAIGVTPSNWANVASYSSTGVVGIYVNDNPVASGPLIDFAGIVIGNTILEVTTSSSISTLVELNAGDTLKCKLAYLTTAPNNFWNTSTNLVQGYFQACWIREN
jgi:hypothetical protein